MFQAKYVIEHVRDILQDVDADRYTELSLLNNLNVAIAEVRRLRPDFFIGRYYSEIGAIQKPDDYINLPVIVFGPLVNYVAGMAEMRDDEYTTDGRAVALITMFRQALTGGTT